MFPASLHSPTLLTATPHFFYIVDCWHHRVLFSPSLDIPLKNWSLLPRSFSFPHSLASNHQALLVDSTGSQQLFLFSLDHQLLEIVDLPSPHHSPHYLFFHPEHQLFYCLCARSQTLLALRYFNHHLTLAHQYSLPFSGHYCRSFYCQGDNFYFSLSADYFFSPTSPPLWQPSGAAILHLRLENNHFHQVATHPLPLPLANPNFLLPYQDYFYLTTTPSLFVRFHHFSDLLENKYQILNHQLSLPGTPYFLSPLENKLYLPFINSSSGILSFSPDSLPSEF